MRMQKNIRRRKESIMKKIKTSRLATKKNNQLPTFEDVEKDMLDAKNKNRDAKQKIKDWFTMISK